MGRLASLKHDRPSSKHHKFPKNGPNSPKLSLKDLPIIFLSFRCFWSLITTASEAFDFKLFPSVLSCDAYHQATGPDVMNGSSKLRQIVAVT